MSDHPNCQFPEHHVRPGRSLPVGKLIAVAVLLWAGASGVLDATILTFSAWATDLLAATGLAVMTVTAWATARHYRRRAHASPAPAAVPTRRRVRALQPHHPALTAVHVITDAPGRTRTPQP
jgi:hypothetical protein